MRALLRAAEDPEYPIRFAVVVSDRAEAPALGAASEFGVDSVYLPARGSERSAFEPRLDSLLRDRRTEVVCLAGFMRVLSPAFVARWSGRILNVHPSLLPRFPGLDPHSRVIAEGATESGCTVHVVTSEVDGGPVLAQARVAVRPGDTAESLAGRVLAEEHRLYPAAAAEFARSALPP